MRRAIAALLAALLAGPPVSLISAPLSGTVQGIVTVEGRPLSGVTLALVDLNSGAIHRMTSAGDGSFRIQVAPGDYIITGGGQEGLAVARGPVRLTVAPGNTASALLDLVSLPVVAPVAATATRVAALHDTQPEPPAVPPQEQAPASEPDATTIKHDPIGCFIAGEFPLVDAGIEPASSVARARAFFKSGLSNDWFFVEMSPQEGQFFGKLPRPRVEASPITYYIQATTTQFGEAQTAEISGTVIAAESDCPDKKIAAIGPAGPVQVFSAATGAAIAPAGFAAGGLALAGGAAAIAGGAAAVGIGTAIVVSNPTPTPTPPPPPPPPPPPTPTPPPPPRPTPTPTPRPPKPIPSPPPVTKVR